MSQPYQVIDRCLACNGGSLRQFLDLKKQPLANSFHSSTYEPLVFPLALNHCFDCFHCQLTAAVTADKMFEHYLYVSGTSTLLLNYFAKFAKELTDHASGNKTVLDIGCNDGSLLSAFKKLGWETYGVDPAQNLHEIALNAGHRIICDYWGENAVVALKVQYGLIQADVITAQNVFAHTTDVVPFLRACRKIMRTDSRLYIQTSQATMFENNEFDTVYHEHISFFCVRSMATLAARAGFCLESVSLADIHGGSYVFVLTVSETPIINDAIKSWIDKEAFKYKTDFYVQYEKNVHDILTEFSRQMEKMRAENRVLIGLGAAAKGMTFLNAAGEKLDYIIDQNPMKQGLMTPGGNIPIVAPTEIQQETRPVAAIPLAWNFFDEMRNNLETIKPNWDIVYIKYFPRVRLLRTRHSEKS